MMLKTIIFPTTLLAKNKVSNTKHNLHNYKIDWK